MRRTILIPALVPVLVLAACGENSGWNPNYRANATPYGDYLRTRESALMGRRGEPPRIVPVTLPVKAPTPEQIAGHSLRPVPEATLAKVRRPAGAPAIDPYPTEPVLATAPVANGKAVAGKAVVVTPVAVTPVMRGPGTVAVAPVAAAPVAVVRSAPTLDAYAPVAARLAEEHLDIHAHIERVDDLALAVRTDRTRLGDLASAVVDLRHDLESHFTYEEIEMTEPLGLLGLGI